MKLKVAARKHKVYLLLNEHPVLFMYLFVLKIGTQNQVIELSVDETGIKSPIEITVFLTIALDSNCGSQTCGLQMQMTKQGVYANYSNSVKDILRSLNSTNDGNCYLSQCK
jgi:hypothetical protein